MTGLADVDGFKISIQVCMWPRFPPLTTWLLNLVKINRTWIYKDPKVLALQANAELV